MITHYNFTNLKIPVQFKILGAEHAAKKYSVTVYTSNVKNAGTDAKVQLMICGTKGTLILYFDQKINFHKFRFFPNFRK